jgi:hypothetical protein
MELYRDLRRVLPILSTLTVTEQERVKPAKSMETLLYTLTYGRINYKMTFAYSTPN